MRLTSIVLRNARRVVRPALGEDAADHADPGAGDAVAQTVLVQRRRLVDRDLHVVGIGDVGAPEARERPEALGRRRPDLLVDVRQQDRDALRDERLRGRCAEA